MIDEMTMVMIARTSSVLSAPVDLSHVHIFSSKVDDGERDRSMRLEGTSEAAALCTTKTSTHPMTIVEEILASPQGRLVSYHLRRCCEKSAVCFRLVAYCGGATSPGGGRWAQTLLSGGTHRSR